MNAGPPTDRCLGCKFFFTHSVTTNAMDENGSITTLQRKFQYCRRYPQYINRSPDNWCGEFKPIAKEELQ